MVVYEVRYEPLEEKWLVVRATTPFSVHETLEDARAAAEEHARSESGAESRVCRVVWRDAHGNSGERSFGPAEARAG
jgi:hypothetical protein